MAFSLLTYSIIIPTTASTVVVRPVLPIRSSMPSLRLTFPQRTPTSFISCCSYVSEKAATSGIDLKPDVERWPKYIPNKLPDKNYVRLEAVKTIAKTVGNECVTILCSEGVQREFLGFKAAPRMNFVFAKKIGFTDIRFGCEDGCRSEKDFLCKIMGEAIKEGVKTVTLADTVGINIPQEFGEMVTYLKANTPGIDDVVVSLHCHNDLGLASANTIAGVRAGARQVEVTVNGIGERSGNASLEEIVMALKCRGAYVMDGVYTTIDTSQIMAASRKVQEYTGLHVQPHKPIVGNNCFVHESGIHQDEMLKNGSTYEIFSPEDIGIERSESSGIVLGKLSGRHAVKVRLRKLGYEIISDEKLRDIFSRFTNLTKQKKRITDADLSALMVLYGDEISSKILEGTVLNEPIPQISSVV
ncbi:unnamed protein product [Brassica napus]|uniref:(rape) hypothetical protein n=1 Tax=Brassica napus TaxID=3708 RepID=A0A816K873_BRANA|nr:unnamed protein product [Brassica napus]